MLLGGVSKFFTKRKQTLCEYVHFLLNVLDYFKCL